MTVKTEDINSAIYATIAKTILDGLDTSDRDALLQKSIAEVIKDYSFKNAIAEVAAEKAKEAATKVMSTQQFMDDIETSIQLGFEDYFKELRSAAKVAAKELIHGEKSDNSYSKRAGWILDCWSKSQKKDE